MTCTAETHPIPPGKSHRFSFCCHSQYAEYDDGSAQVTLSFARCTFVILWDYRDVLARLVLQNPWCFTELPDGGRWQCCLLGMGYPGPAAPSSSAPVPGGDEACVDCSVGGPCSMGCLKQPGAAGFRVTGCKPRGRYGYHQSLAGKLNNAGEKSCRGGGIPRLCVRLLTLILTNR